MQKAIRLGEVLFCFQVRLPKQAFDKTRNKKVRLRPDFLHSSAEKEGFEPPDLLQSTVFKTAAIDRSAISPGAKVIIRSDCQKKKCSMSSQTR